MYVAPAAPVGPEANTGRRSRRRKQLTRAAAVQLHFFVSACIPATVSARVCSRVSSLLAGSFVLALAFVAVAGHFTGGLLITIS